MMMMMSALVQLCFSFSLSLCHHLLFFITRLHRSLFACFYVSRVHLNLFSFTAALYVSIAVSFVSLPHLPSSSSQSTSLSFVMFPLSVHVSPLSKFSASLPLSRKAEMELKRKQEEEARKRREEEERKIQVGAGGTVTVGPSLSWRRGAFL